MKKNIRTKKKILDAALLVFNEKGFSNTSVPQIVKKASLAQGTFYRYFKDKRECFNILIKRLLDIFYIEIERTLKDTNTDALITGPRRAIELIYKNKDLIRLMTIENQHVDQDLREKLNSLRPMMDSYCKTQLVLKGDSEQSAVVKAKLISNVVDSVVLNDVILETPPAPEIQISIEMQLEGILYDLKRGS